MQRMRDLMRGSLARSLRTLPEEDRLAAALPLVCGSAMAAHCTVERLDEQRTLHLRVDTSQWLRSLTTMRDVLQRDLARTAGVVIEDVQFEPLRRPPGARVGQAQASRRAPGSSTFRKRGSL